MNIRQVSPQVYVSEQITQADLRVLAEAGFKTVINNRPDGEAAGQPRSADLAAVATSLGMEFIFFPVRLGAITEEQVESFADICQGIATPALLFCRTGTRSTALWQFSQSRTPGNGD